MKNVRAKKHLGQHFLNDPSIASEIINLLKKNTQNVLEIGPGMGALTQLLLKKNYTTHVVEIDKESVTYLKKKFPNLNIHEGDFLKLNIKQKYPFNFSLIGNFPYNISSQILFKILDNRDQITEIVGMFQKEVAERVFCKQGRKRGILSVLLQTFYDIEYCRTVDENVFIPQPKVKSAVLRLMRNKRKKLHVNENKFRLVVKSAFHQRRKKLSNALKAFKLTDNEKILNLLNLRAEQLSVEDFIKITSYVK